MNVFSGKTLDLSLDGMNVEHVLRTLRYLRAVKWTSAEKAIQRIEVTLKWRREYGISDVVTADHVEPEVCNLYFIVRVVLMISRLLPVKKFYLVMILLAVRLSI
jgi:hypothetical protein